MEQGKQTNDFFHCFVDHTGRKSWRLKSLETYSKEHNVEETPSKKYFTATKLPDIVKGYSLGKKAGKPAEVQKGELRRREEDDPEQIQIRDLTIFYSFFLRFLLSFRNGQPSFIHRFRRGIAEHGSCKAMDSSTSQASSLHYQREIRQTFRAAFGIW